MSSPENGKYQEIPGKVPDLIPFILPLYKNLHPWEVQVLAWKYAFDAKKDKKHTKE